MNRETIGKEGVKRGEDPEALGPPPVEALSYRGRALLEYLYRSPRMPSYATAYGAGTACLASASLKSQSAAV